MFISVRLVGGDENGKIVLGAYRRLSRLRPSFPRESISKSVFEIRAFRAQGFRLPGASEGGCPTDYTDRLFPRRHYRLSLISGSDA